MDWSLITGSEVNLCKKTKGGGGAESKKTLAMLKGGGGGGTQSFGVVLTGRLEF